MRRRYVDPERPPARVLHHWLKLRRSMNRVADMDEFDDVDDFEVVLEQERPGRWSVSVRVKESDQDVKFSTPYTFYRGKWHGHSLKVIANGEDQGDFGNDLMKAMTELLGKKQTASPEGHTESENTRGTGYGSVGQRRASVIRV